MGENISKKDKGKKVVLRGIHGLYASLPQRMKIDGRSKFGKAILQLKTSLIADLGGEISTQQSLLVDRAVFKVLRLSSFEAFLLKSSQEGTEKDATEKQAREYLTMSNSLRLDLCALGLNRRMKDITPLSARLAALAREEESRQDEGTQADQNS